MTALQTHIFFLANEVTWYFSTLINDHNFVVCLILALLKTWTGSKQFLLERKKQQKYNLFPVNNFLIKDIHFLSNFAGNYLLAALGQVQTKEDTFNNNSVPRLNFNFNYGLKLPKSQVGWSNLDLNFFSPFNLLVCWSVLKIA